MAPELKICGITRLEDARYCAAAGADYLGFVQHPESTRYIAPSAAKDIIDWVYGPKTVGVFVNRTAAEINDSVEQAGFAIAQLHGDESPDVCDGVTVPVIKAVRIGDGFSAAGLDAFFRRYRDVADFFLLDTRVDGLWGGSGAVFDWDIASALSDEVPVFLAGGIRASNVGEAIRRVVPHGIDISSGLESSPGVKDFEKIDAFFDEFDRIRRNQNETAGR
jgi:phosphoribosylanthranilate isomerase